MSAVVTNALYLARYVAPQGITTLFHNKADFYRLLAGFVCNKNVTPYTRAAVTFNISLQVEYKKDLENTKGHSINFCETPQFQNAAKVAKFTSDVSIRPDLFNITVR